MKVLVTGGTGLIGQAIQKISKLLPSTNEYIFLSSRECDLIDSKAVLQLFEKYKPDQVIHLAAVVGGLYKNMNNNLMMYSENLIMNFNIVECCHIYGVKKSVFCLSTCIFPDVATSPGLSYPINETDLHKGPPHDSNKGYSYAKRMLQVHTELYNDYYSKNGMKNRMICVIPTNVYGEYDNFNLENGHVLASLIHKCYLAFENGTSFVIKGTGKPVRQFIYSEDLAFLILLIMKEEIKENSIILAPNIEDEVSIGELAKIIYETFEKIYGKSINMEYDSSFSDGQFKKTADNSLLKKYIPYEFTELKDGVKNVVAWFIKNFETARK